MRVNQPNTDINVFLPVLFVRSFVLLIYVLYNLFRIGILLKEKKPEMKLCQLQML